MHTGHTEWQDVQKVIFFLKEIFFRIENVKEELKSVLE
jgi:hypothetical protein